MSKIGNQTVLVRFETNSAHGGLLAIMRRNGREG